MISPRFLHAPLRRSRERVIDLLFLAPALAVLAGFLLYPLAWGIVLSVHDSQGFDLAGFVGLDHYVRALTGDAIFHESLLHTLLFAAVAVVAQTGVGLLLAVLLSDVRRGRGLLQLLFFVPFVVAPVAVGVIWRYLYAPFFGVIASVGSALGLDTATVAPLADERTALWAIMVAFIWRFAGFTTIVYLAAMRGLPNEYREHALLEGASRFQQLRQVTWPLLWPQTFAIVLLTTLGALRMFDMVWIMTGGGPAHATETVATHVYATAFRFFDVGYAQAMSMILLVVILALALVEIRLLDRRAQAVSG
jgi:raffinose/stachyose/melibiose transport system permease protein